MSSRPFISFIPWKRLSAHAAVVVALTGCRAEIHASPSLGGTVAGAEDADLAWTAMRRVLSGTFRATTPENRTITASYKLVSRGSALVETFTSASGNETMTVYHRDGHALVLTHYCAQGNQAHLRASETTNDRVTFTFASATNATSDQSVMQTLAFAFRADSADSFDQESVYRTPSGELEASTLHFQRVAASSPIER
jgi:hypothetical protein